MSSQEREMMGREGVQATHRMFADPDVDVTEKDWVLVTAGPFYGKLLDVVDASPKVGGDPDEAHHLEVVMLERR